MTTVARLDDLQAFRTALYGCLRKRADALFELTEALLHAGPLPSPAQLNLQRAYAFADEDGLLLCSWPHGGRPKLPFVYSDEVWTGIEYHVAAHLIYEGRLQEGLTIVSALRARHDGYRRNPWNEVECGHHYARSLASWSLIPALTGFHCDVEHKMLHFDPVNSAEDGTFQTLFTCGAGWGIYGQVRRGGEVQPSVVVLGGNLDGFTVRAGEHSWQVANGRLAAPEAAAKPGHLR